VQSIAGSGVPATPGKRASEVITSPSMASFEAEREGVELVGDIIE
jgi:hypothetical protein